MITTFTFSSFGKQFPKRGNTFSESTGMTLIGPVEPISEITQVLS